MNTPSFFDITGLSPRSAARWDQIEEAEHELGCQFPEDYRAFLKESNGVEGFVCSSAYLVLWPVQEIAQLNAAYATTEFAPGLVLLGTNGGNIGYGFTGSQANLRYVQVPLIGMDLDVMEPIGKTLIEMVKHMCLGS